MALPLPKVIPDVEKGGGVVTAMRGLNALRDEQLQARMRELQNQYYPQETQANIASKTAYAKYIEPEILTKLSSNPQFWAQLSPDQQNSFVNRTRESIMNPTNPLAQISSPKVDNGLFGMLINKLSGQQNQPSSQVLASSSSDLSQKPINQEVVKNKAPIGAVDQSTLPLTSRQAELDYARGRKTGNPAIDVQARLVAEKERGKAEEKSFVKEWASKTKELGAAAQGAYNFSENLKSFNANYPKLSKYERGFAAGRLPGASDAAQIVDKVSAQAEQSLARAFQTNHITNVDFQSAQKAVPRRSLEPGAAKNIPAQLEAVQKRIREKVPFYQRAKKLGLDVGEADQAWNEYIEENPLFNHNTDKLIPRKGNEYISFLNPEKLQNIRSGISPESKQSEVIEPEKSLPILEKRTINGKNLARDSNGWYEL